jgi:signal peptidase
MIAVASLGLLVVLGIGPRTGRYSTLTVLSGSMRPGIPVGAVVLDTPQAPTALRVGQIITYAIPVDDHHVISHRVVKIVSGGTRPVFVTKGDANNAADPWQAQANGETMWRVRAVIPGLGTAIHWLRRPIVHQIGVLVFPTMLAVSCLISIWRADESDSPTPSDGPVSSPISISA